MSDTVDLAAKVPAHVPPELVWDHRFDAFTMEGGDPFQAICRLHDGPPVIWSTDASYGRPGWVVTRYDFVSEVFMDYERFGAERTGMIADLVGENIRLNPIEIDPPAHHGYRRILNPHFTPKAIKGVEAAVRAACVDLISRFENDGGCEFIGKFAIPFPSYIFLDLMGMPREKVDDFIGWEEKLMRAPDPMERMKAARSVYEYLKAHKEKQKVSPSNDFLRDMVNGQYEGRPLTHLELMGMFYVLYVGGLDTVYSTLGWTMRHLATHPELQQRLRENPELIPNAVEEFCRAFSVVVTHREVAKDCTFHGIEMKKGEEVNLPLSLADRDPSVFANPHEVDIERKSRHIAFGTGTHNCLGIHLAKRELRMVVEEFLSRFRDIRIRDGETYRYHTGRTFGIDYLPLALTPA
ncbi:cytochrome P450 [Novosphingobium mangrovi (ex Huang et al. 2023)]|uniref:Cytochrome P450 n=1 Tax=Novosphingobium mangrovi (ex Huang et al. 2023) TaxID=2976432 RepID=A0ABT2I542_9SPHN|nr:cytochrome P450 [Novosphingobium mangrovi (ex Huang et al. 2023)]MCT2399919.1 cytochrome P450 [Novosphingobium mangrovi (ex Huang et al. 2023)]